MILFVRSSILVLAPKAQHVYDPKASVSLEVRIYSGADSSFLLFEDDGKDSAHERPATSILFSWSEAGSLLEIGEQRGAKYPGMPESRLIHVVLVRPGHGVGVDECDGPDVSVKYHGERMLVDLHKTHAGIE